MSLASRIASLEARERRGAGFVLFVQTDRADRESLCAQAEADGADLAKLPPGTKLARGLLTPAERAEHEKREAAWRAYCIASKDKEVHDAFDGIDCVHAETEADSLWWPYIAYRQIVLRGGFLWAYQERLGDLLLKGTSEHPLSSGMPGYRRRGDPDGITLQEMAERYRLASAGTLRPIYPGYIAANAHLPTNSLPPPAP